MRLVKRASSTRGKPGFQWPGFFRLVTSEKDRKLEMLDEAHFEKWNKARQERDCWIEAVEAARDTFGEDHEVTRWAKAQLADAEADYGVVVDVLIPSDGAK